MTALRMTSRREGISSLTLSARIGRLYGAMLTTTRPCAHAYAPFPIPSRASPRLESLATARVGSRNRRSVHVDPATQITPLTRYVRPPAMHGWSSDNANAKRPRLIDLIDEPSAPNGSKPGFAFCQKKKTVTAASRVLGPIEVSRRTAAKPTLSTITIPLSARTASPWKALPIRHADASGLL